MVKQQKTYEEKIIDGFAICSFRTWEDLQAASISSINLEEDIEESVPRKIKSKKKTLSLPCSSSVNETDKDIETKEKSKTTTNDDAHQKVKCKKKLLSPPCSSSKKKSEKDIDLNEKPKATIEEVLQKTKSKKKSLSPPCSPSRKKSQKDVDLKEKHKTVKDSNEILKKSKNTNKISSKEKSKIKREHKHSKSKTIKGDCCDNQPKRKKPKKEPSSSSSRSETASNDSCTNEENNDGESKSDDHELQVSSTISTGSISSSTVVTIKTSTTTKSCKVSNHTSSTSRSSISILNQPLSETSQANQAEPKCSSTSTTTTSTSSATATTTNSATAVIDSNISSSKGSSPPSSSPSIVIGETVLPKHSPPVISSKASVRPCCPISSRPQSPINSNMVTITNESSTMTKTTKVTGRSAVTPTSSIISRIPTNTATLTASQSMTSKAMTTKLQSTPMQSQSNNHREEETVYKRQIPTINIGNSFNHQNYPILPPSFSGHGSTAHASLTSTSNKSHQEFFRLEELRSRKDSHLPMQDMRSYHHDSSSVQHPRPPVPSFQSFGPAPCISTHTPPLTVPSSLHFSPNSNNRNKQQNTSIHQISPIRSEPNRTITSGPIHQSSQPIGYTPIPIPTNAPTYHSSMMSDYSPSTRIDHNPSLATQSAVKRELGERFLATHQMEKFAAAAASANLAAYGPKPLMYPSLQTHIQHASTAMHPCYQQHQSSLMNPPFGGQPSICITDTISRHSTTSIIPAQPTGPMGLSGSMISQTATSRFGAISNMSVDMGMHPIPQSLPSSYNQPHNLYPPNLAPREMVNHLSAYPFNSPHLLPQLGRLGPSTTTPSMMNSYTNALELARYNASAVDPSILLNRACHYLNYQSPFI